MKKDVTTSGLYRALSQAHDVGQVVDDFNCQVDIKQHLAELLRVSGKNIADLAKDMLASKVFIYQIFEGTRKPGRDMLLRMAFALNLTLEETQRLLMIAQRGALYPKVRRDAVIIHALQHGYSLCDTDETLRRVDEQPIIGMND